MALLDARSSIPPSPGVYILCMRAPMARDIVIGKRGTLHVDDQATFVYVGSALNGLHARLGRHLNLQGKRIRWHVDYLLQAMNLFQAWYAVTADRKECELSMHLHQQARIFTAVDGIGNSDCHSCPSHLYRYLETSTPGALDAGLRAAFDDAGLQPIICPIGSEPQTNEPRMQPRME